MRFINRHSFIFVAVSLVLVLGIILLRDGVKVVDLAAMALLLTGLGLAFFFLRPGAGPKSEADLVLGRIGAGRPVLLEFQSNF